MTFCDIGVLYYIWTPHHLRPIFH